MKRAVKAEVLGAEIREVTDKAIAVREGMRLPAQR